MQITTVTPEFSVSPQISPRDVAEVAALGFRSVICNRPDGEDPNQPEVALIRAEAEAKGLAFAFIPVVSGQIRPDQAADLRKALAEMPTPVLAYCRSGTRSRQLWSLATE